MLRCDIQSINRLLEQDPLGYVAQVEAAYQQKIQAAAEQVLLQARQKPVVLVSGPSGSGKTTSAQKLAQALDSHGVKTHTISMDNYFYSWSDGTMPLDDDGNVDLESPLRLDAQLLSEHLERIARCEPVEIPSFDFANQRRTDKTLLLSRRAGELVILEGIHALNPQVTGSAGDFSLGIYVSVRTRMVGRNRLILHPEKIRLLRRLLRDSLYRGQSYRHTIARLKSVSRGEGLYIMPYKYRATLNIDTFLPYEVAVYRDELLAGIHDLDQEFLAEMGVSDMKQLLEESAAFPREQVPADSLLREFIGEA